MPQKHIKKFEETIKALAARFNCECTNQFYKDAPIPERRYGRVVFMQSIMVKKYLAETISQSCPKNMGHSHYKYL